MGFINRHLQDLLDGPLDVHAPQAIDMHIHVEDGIVLMNYRNTVPPFAERWLERLYGSIFSSLAHYRIYDGIAGIHTYVACENEHVLAVLLYRTEGAQLRVLNEAVRLPAEEVERFARHIFATQRDIDVISLHAVALDGTGVSYPSQRFNCLEDIVLRLPSSASEYMAGLGKATRSYISRYQKKLSRDFPSFTHMTYSRHEIQESHLHAILALNCSRMEAKGKQTPWTDRHERCMLELARMCGMVKLIAIDECICAGTLNYRIHDNYFLEVVAHAPEYNEYRLGTLCCYATVCECIAAGGKEYHFLWGESDYKYRLGGVRQDLEHMAIYRSRRRMVTHASLALDNIYQSQKRKMHLHINEMRRQHAPLAKPLDLAIHSLDSGRLAWHRKKHVWPESNAAQFTKKS